MSTDRWMKAFAFVATCAQLVGCANAFGDSVPAAVPAVVSTLSSNDQNVVASNCDVESDPNATVTEVGMSDMTELGFSAHDVLAAGLGEHVMPLAWNDAKDVETSPETGEHTLRVTIEPRSEHARVVIMKRTVGHGQICHSRMEIDVTITLQSDAGALNDRLDAVLFTQSRHGGFVSATAYGKKLGGTLSVRNYGVGVSNPDPNWINLILEVSETGVSGQLTGMWGWPETELAHFGRGHCGVSKLEVGLDAPASFAGAQPQVLVDRFNALSPLQTTWADDSVSETTLTFHPDEISCAYVAYDTAELETQLSMTGMLSARSSDGRLLGEQPALIDTEDFGSQPAFFMTVVSDDIDASTVTPAALGFPMLSRDGTELLELKLQTSIDGSNHVDGNIDLSYTRPRACTGAETGPSCTSVTRTLEHAVLR